MRPSFAGSAVLVVAMTGALPSAPGVAATERAFDASGFDAVVLHGPDDVEVVPGDAFSVRATGEESALAGLDVTSQDGVLHVERADGADFDGSVSGSGGVDVGGLRVERLDASVSGSGDVRASVTGSVTASIDGSGDVEVTGGAECRSDVSGSGELRCD